MEDLKNSNENEPFLKLNDELNYYLQETSKWSKFLAILGFVILGLIGILGIVMIFIFSKLFNQFSSGLLSALPIAIFYIIAVIVFYMPLKYLYNFSIQMKEGLLSKDTRVITSSFKSLKSLFKYITILSIILLSFYAIGGLIALVPLLASF